LKQAIVYWWTAESS